MPSCYTHSASSPEQSRDIKASLPDFLPIVAALLASMVVAINAAMRAEGKGWRGELWPIIMSSGLLLLVIIRQAIICLDRSRLRREKAVAQAHTRALVELARRKDEFLGVVSHEIRTPLASVHGYIQLLARRLGAWQPPADGAAVPAALVARAVAQAGAVLASCEQSLQRLIRLADDLSDDTRIRDGQLTLRQAPCDLCALVRSTVEALRLVEPDRVILLCLPCPRCAPSADGGATLVVEADADRIAQVITDFLSNALKYSRADQPVEVVVEALRQPGEGAGEAESKGVVGQAGVARVAVRDAGPGLSEAEQARVWERYPHIETVKVQCGSGVSLGLGLSISKAIIERHGGEVAVESAPGQGSTFWFTLPLATPTTLASPAART
jgi:signal transduction histidine kinase